MTAKLKLVPQTDNPLPDYSYESEERRRIRERDWAAVHVAADRRKPLNFFDRIKRTWR